MRRPGAAVVHCLVLQIREMLCAFLLLLVAAHVVGGLNIGAEDDLHPPRPLAHPALLFKDCRAVALEFGKGRALFNGLGNGVIDGFKLIALGYARDCEGAGAGRVRAIMNT